MLRSRERAVERIKVDSSGWADSLFMLFELLISSCLGRNVLICILDGRAGYMLGIGLLLTASHRFRRSCPGEL